ncbi:MAG: DUF3667 domain-containing protein [Flavobacteriaceae bacterium]|nr:DUF3667 domain-containing protein [Flavobacteriaceae bacterium]
MFKSVTKRRQVFFCFGARYLTNRLTINGLFKEFATGYFNPNNLLVKTFRDLTLSPEAVSDSFINRTRKPHTNSVSFFTLSVSLSGLYVFISIKIFSELMVYPNPEVQGFEA